MSDRRFRVAVAASHPIQYLAPWFRHLAQSVDLTVFYAHRQDASGQSAAGYEVEFDWDVPLLDGYTYEWLENVAAEPSLQTFSGCDTPGIGEKLEAGRFDACLTLGWHRKSFLQAMLAARRQRLPLLVRGDSRLPAVPKRWKAALKWLPHRTLLPRAAGHLYVGTKNREYLEHYGVPEDRLFFSPHAVDQRRFRDASEAARQSGEAAQIRRQLGLAEETFVIGFVGRLVEIKRPELLLRGIAHAARGRPKDALALAIIGDGPLAERVAELAEALDVTIAWAGFRNQSELPAYYATLDAIALTSEQETWGMVINEAAACGVPAVVSDSVGCAPDLIVPGLTGEVFASGDIAALGEAILALESSAGSRREEVEQALAAKCEEYSFERATAGLVEALEQTTARTRGNDA